MKFERTLVRGRFLSRYKRFFVDVELEGGNRVTAHCANTGTLRSCLVTGAGAWLMGFGPESKRKLPYSLELVEVPEGGYVSVNTQWPNRVVGEALTDRRIRPLAGYTEIRAEVPFGSDTRFDFALSTPVQRQTCYVEVKQVTWLDGDRCLFPDAETERGQRHLSRLIEAKTQGFAAACVFVVTRPGGRAFHVAREVDARYAELLQEAHDAGVWLIAHRAVASPAGILLDAEIPVALY